MEGDREKGAKDGEENWRKEGADSVLQEAGIKPLGDYKNKRQAAVSEWVTLLPIFEVCAKETGYKGGWSVQKPW